MMKIREQIGVQPPIRSMIFLGISTIIAFTLLQSGCSSSANKKKAIVDTVLSSNWVRDSIGCKRLRNKSLANQLVKDNHLMNNTKERFLEVFQVPNERANSKDAEILKYYFTTMCENGKINPTSENVMQIFISSPIS